MFGSDEMKEFLRAQYKNPGKCQEMNDKIYEVVRNYAKVKFAEGFKPNEVGKGSKALETRGIAEHVFNTIVNETVVQVLLHLDGFMINIDKYNEKQRSAWLRSILYTSAAKFLRKKEKIKQTLMGEAINNLDCGRNMEQTIEDRLKFETGMRKFMQIVCNAPSKPEKILAYLILKIALG